MHTPLSPLDYAHLLQDGMAKLDSGIASVDVAKASAARLLARTRAIREEIGALQEQLRAEYATSTPAANQWDVNAIRNAAQRERAIIDTMLALSKDLLGKD